MLAVYHRTRAPLPARGIAMRGFALARCALVLALATVCVAQGDDSELNNDLPPTVEELTAETKPAKKDRFAETRRVLEVRRKMLGETHPDTLVVMRELSRAMQNAPSTRREGLEMEKQADALYKRMHDGDHSAPAGHDEL